MRNSFDNQFDITHIMFIATLCTIQAWEPTTKSLSIFPISPFLPQVFCFLSTILFIAVAIFMLICFVVTEWIKTTVHTPGAQIHAVTNELDEDVANEQTTSFIA